MTRTAISDMYFSFRLLFVHPSFSLYHPVHVLVAYRDDRTSAGDDISLASVVAVIGQKDG